MKRMPLIAAAALAGAAIAAPAAAYPLVPTGPTNASPQLTLDLLRTISRYSRDNGGCSFLFSVKRQILPTPASLAGIGGHLEDWSVNACAARQHFQIAMWPSPRGGTDFTVRPTTGRLPLTMP